MDFCVVDKEEIEKDINSEILRPFLADVDYSKIKIYLQLPEYNDPFIKTILSSKLYPTLQNRILSIDNKDKKVR